MTIQECGDGDSWTDPAAHIRTNAMDYAVEILSAHAPDAGQLTPEQIAQGTITVAQSFEAYLSGGDFLSPGPPVSDSLY